MSTSTETRDGKVVSGRRPAWLDALIGDAPRVTAIELLVCLAGLSLIAVVAYGPHVLNGGFYNDDWAFSSTYRYRPEGGVIGAIEAFDWMSFRPLAMVYWPLTHELFGLDPAGHLAWATGMAVLMAASLFLVLRMLGMARLHAGAISALVLLFPAADASKLWPAAAIALPAITFYLLGTAIALRGLVERGPRSIVLHGVAIVLYLMSIMTYEVAAGPILASILLYRLRVGWRRAASRWIADVAAVVPVLVLVTSNTWNERQPIDVQVRHAWTIARQAATVFAGAANPFGTTPTVVVVALTVGIVAGGLVAMRLMPREHAARRSLRVWLLTVLGALLAIAGGYSTFVPSDPAAYSPLGPGQQNRMNILASIGLVILVYALAMVVVTVVAWTRPTAPVASAAAAVALAVVLGAGYGSDLRSDADLWDRSAAVQASVVNGIERAVPRPPAGSVIFAFGVPSDVAPGIPVFAARWDLDGAVKANWDDPSLVALPAVPGTHLLCGRHAAVMRNSNDNYPGGPQRVPLAAGTSWTCRVRAPGGSTTGLLPGERRGAPRRGAPRGGCRAGRRRRGGLTAATDGFPAGRGVRWRGPCPPANIRRRSSIVSGQGPCPTTP